MPDWTKAQRAAIYTVGSDVLVSAAAGSGKTATLTERIINHIKDGASLDRFLIVTFSRAAAADMKAKLLRELRRRAEDAPDDKALARAIAELPSARIGTIHSFCASLLRRYYGELSLPAKSRIADEAEAKLMKRECMDESLDYFYSLPEGTLPEGELPDPETDFVALTDHLLGAAGDEVLADTLLMLYDKTSCLPRRHETLADSAAALRAAATDGSFLLSDSGAPVRRHVKRGLDYYIAIFDTAVTELAVMEGFAEKHLPAYEYISRFLHTASTLLSLGDYVALSEHLLQFAPPSLRSVKGDKLPRTEYFKDKKAELTKFIKAIRASYFSVSAEELARTLRRTASVTMGIVRVLDEFDRRYAAEKRRRGALDYGDLEHYALRLLSDPQMAARVAADYDEIYIDEYQDCNAVQDQIFAAVARRNRYMVGDVKQSIYAFRGADPTLFDSHRRSYRKVDTDTDTPDYGSAVSDGASVFMSDNFRCDSTVIDFTNAVCGAIMPYGNVSYTDEDALRFGKAQNGAPLLTAPPSPVKIVLAVAEKSDADADEDGAVTSGADAEAEVLAREVESLLRSGRAPDDIAILLRSVARGRAQRIEDALCRHGIGVSNDAKPNFFECPEVLLVLCLLHTINNPLRDVYFAGALRSPVFGFSLDELISIGQYGGTAKRPLYRSFCELAKSDLDTPLADKCRRTLNTVERWRRSAQFASADDIIAALYKETGIEALLRSDANRNNGTTPPSQRAANLDALYEYARTYEANSYHGLHRFLEYISSIIDSGATAIGDASAASSGNVRIMTIHQSKGLEFPVVILANCGTARNEKDARASLIYEKTAGAAMCLRADDLGQSTVMLETLPHRAVAAAMSESLAAEEMRLLYVALTRAKEQLIITAKTDDAEKAVARRRENAEFFGEHTVFSERSYIGWILSSLFYRESVGEDISAYCRIVSADVDLGVDTVLVGDKDGDNIDTSVTAPPDRAAVTEAKALITEQLSFVYPYSRIGKLPAKLAVSMLHPAVLDEDATMLDNTTLDDGALKERSDDPARAPSPEAEAAAKAGTATHLYMQFCDFAAAETLGVRAESERLCRLGFMRQEDADLIRFDEVEAFLRSDIYGKMKRARQLWRERRFNIRLPASDFTENPDDRELYSDEELLVQGVIDCFFLDENGDLILLDYKTDRLSPYELSHRRAAEEKLSSRHKRQLSYYEKALSAIFGKPPKHTCIYSLPLGDTIEVKTR